MARLPELYQPIWRHPELGATPARPCEDRLALISPLCEALTAHLGRPARVLDLGCSQGYFSLALAEGGACVTGVDYNAENIAVCRLLADEHPAATLSFSQGRVEETIEALTPGAFDLVLGLSVFHHVLMERGQDATAALIARCARHVAIGIFEVALESEGMYWSAAQPSDPRALLGSYEFVMELGRAPTHLSDRSRPLFVASSRMAFVGRALYPFEEVLHTSHALTAGVHQGTRRYLLGPEVVIKVFRTDGPLADTNRDDLRSEAQFLRRYEGRITSLPRLLDAGFGQSDAWLVRRKVEGDQLLAIMARGEPFDGPAIATDILQIAAELEQAGLFHADLRAWNILVGTNGRASVIDYGSISERAFDATWPDDVFLSFFILLHELATGHVARAIPARAPFTSPWNLPSPYREPAAAFWALPPAQWSFARLLEIWREGGSNAPAPTSDAAWQAAIERYLELMAQRQEHIDAGSAARFSQLHGEFGALRTGLADGRSALTDHGRQQQELRDRVTRSEATSADRTKQVDSLQQALAHMVATLPEIPRALDGARTAAEADRSHSDARFDTLQASMASLSDRVARMLALMETHDAEIDSLRSQLDESEQARAASALAAEEATAARATIERALHQAHRSLEERRAELQRSSRQIVAMRERHERQITHYVQELSQAQCALPSPNAASPSRFARISSHPIVNTVLRLDRRATAAAEMLMDAPLFTRTPFQPTFVANESGRYSLDDFLVLHDREFVRATYLAILRRPADPDGEAFYLAQVRSGEYKSRILDQLLRSEEGRSKTTVIEGLREHLRILRICRIPILGRWIAAVLFLARVEEHLRELRAFENHVIRMAEEAQVVHEANIRKLRSII